MLFTIFLLWRFAIFIPLVISIYLLSPNISADFTYLYNPTGLKVASFNSIFLLPWANFDGIHYLNIAQYGYINQARFFPLFPILINLLSSHFLASLLLVSALFFLSLFVFKKLIKLDFSNEVANQSLFYILIFPTAFFFVSIYSEGLFLLLTLLAFYFARKRRWLLSIVCAMFLMTTRFVGIAILPALLYEFFTSDGGPEGLLRGGASQYKKLALFLLAPLGLIAYSVFNYYKWDNFLYFISAQGELGNNRTVAGIVLFPQTVYRYIKILSTVTINSYEWGIALLELASFLFVSFLLYFAWKRKIRTSYLIFALINFAVTVSTGTFSALPRYVLTIFPIFIALALLENRMLKYAYMIISPILLFILLMLFSRGYYVS